MIDNIAIVVADLEGGPWGPWIPPLFKVAVILCRMHVACLLKLFFKMAYCSILFLLYQIS